MIIRKGLEKLMLCTGKWVPVLVETINKEIKLGLHIIRSYIFDTGEENILFRYHTTFQKLQYRIRGRIAIKPRQY